MTMNIEALFRKATPETIRASVREVVGMVAQRIQRGGRNLVYILAQSSRFGHFGLETQIVRSMYEDSYDRIIIVTGDLDVPGTNPWIPHCAGPKVRFVHTKDLAVQMLGFVDGGIAEYPYFDILFAQPRRLFIDFYHHVMNGGRIASLTLPAPIEDRARDYLQGHGLDPDEPFVFFHNRTLQYHPEMAYHGHRTADVTSYRDCLALLIDAGYRVIRLGERGMDTMGFDPDRYVNLPDLPNPDPAVDVFVCARCAFGLAQNSGPIWVVAAFGNRVLRTNTPFEHLNMPYNRDISLFKHYRRIGSRERLGYREILEARVPSLFQDEHIAAAGFELLPNDPEELLAACREQLAYARGEWQPDDVRQERFWSMGGDYERRLLEDPEMVKRTLAFYGFAHPFGYISQSFLDANPGFLD